MENASTADDRPPSPHSSIRASDGTSSIPAGKKAPSRFARRTASMSTTGPTRPALLTVATDLFDLAPLVAPRAASGEGTRFWDRRRENGRPEGSSTYYRPASRADGSGAAGVCWKARCAPAAERSPSPDPGEVGGRSGRATQPPPTVCALRPCPASSTSPQSVAIQPSSSGCTVHPLIRTKSPGLMTVPPLARLHPARSLRGTSPKYPVWRNAGAF